MVWKKVFPDLEQSGEDNVDVVSDLIDKDMVRVYRRFSEKGLKSLFDVGLTVFRANMSESYCERVILVANQVMTKGRTLLSDEHLEMLCVLPEPDWVEDLVTLGYVWKINLLYFSVERARSRKRNGIIHQSSHRSRVALIHISATESRERTLQGADIDLIGIEVAMYIKHTININKIK